jgi:NADPH:quinone reductase-like Zn-dependent oxidoreductase
MRLYYLQTVVPDSVSDADAACAVINPVTVVGMMHEVSALKLLSGSSRK